MTPNDPNTHIVELSRKLLEGTISAEEKQELADWLNKDDRQALIIPSDFAASQAELEQRMLETIRSRTGERYGSPRRIRQLQRGFLKYAAAIIVLAATAYLWTISHRQTEKMHSGIAAAKDDIPPGTDKATLTLGNGEQISLDPSSKNVLKKKGIDNTGSTISYAKANEVNTTNILTTPRGGQYKLRLSDGTMVWLNAASSISYPAVFNSNKRQVSITGEAFFEVAPDKSRPFTVLFDGRSIEVLGTSFNVNAYTDEPYAATTLVEGAIKIDEKILKPGQAYGNGKISAADIAHTIAWKNGGFSFDNLSLPQVLRQLSRWYDVEIVYEGKVPDKLFGGEIGRNLRLSQVLEILEGLEVKFEIQGKKLIVRG